VLTPLGFQFQLQRSEQANQLLSAERLAQQAAPAMAGVHPARAVVAAQQAAAPRAATEMETAMAMAARVTAAMAEAARARVTERGAADPPQGN
jgi:predicted urease superfamily metal-dependent hydrolase